MLETVLHRVQNRIQMMPRFGAAQSLRRRVWQGAYWTLFGYGASQLLRFGGNLILTRLLFPELFGLMALVNTFLLGLALLSDLGLSAATVQNPRGNESAFYNTVWTIQSARGIGLWCASFVLAIPFAEFYGEPLLRWVIPVAAVSVLLAGFNSPRLYLLERELRIRTVTKIELGSQVCGLVVMIGWAWYAPGVWALVAGGVFGAAVKLAASHWVNRGTRNQLHSDASAARAVWAFGKWIFLASAIGFFAEQADRLMLGKVTPLEILGVYGIALTFAELPRQITLALSSKVLFPAFSILQSLPRPELRAAITRHRTPMLYLLAGAVAALVCFGDALVRFLYDARYWQAAWMLPILALGLWPRLLCGTLEPALFAIGKPQYTTAAQATRVVWTVGGVLLGFALAGIFGAIAAIALNDLLYYLVIQVGLWREGLAATRQDAQVTFVFLLLIGAVLSARVLVGGRLPF
jgi:O-antigen/teichoic acid export membrane protein